MDAYGASGLRLEGLPSPIASDFPSDPSTTCVAETTNLVAGASCVLACTFHPTSVGNYNETTNLQYSTEHNGSGYSLLGPSFIGTTISTQPTANVSPGSLIFGSVGVGVASAAQSVMLTNGVGATLSIASIASSGRCA